MLENVPSDLLKTGAISVRSSPAAAALCATLDRELLGRYIGTFADDFVINLTAKNPPSIPTSCVRWTRAE